MSLEKISFRALWLVVWRAFQRPWKDFSPLARITLNGISFGASIVAALELWKRITWLREPKWLRRTPLAKSPSWLGHIYGTILAYVTTGNFCRRFMSSETPDLLRFQNGLGGGLMRDFVLIKDPKIAVEILTEKKTRKPEKGYRLFKRLTGYRGSTDFLSAESHNHPVYKRTRGVVYSTLMARTYNHYESVFVPTVAALVKRIKCSGDGYDVKIVDEMHHVATSLITRVGFDEHSENFDKSLFDSALWIINDMLQRPQNNAFKFLDDLPTPWNYELKRRQHILVSTIEQMVSNKREKMVSKPGVVGDDVISVLLSDENNSASDLLGVLSIFFFAGFDTTSNAMTMALHYLANNPEIQTKCRDEVRKVIGVSESPSLQKLFQLDNLQAVIKETLRMHPTVPMIAREITEPHASGICPRFNEEDTFGVSVNLIGLHYNEKGWTDPQKFVPNRWTDASIDAQKDPQQRVYCPFALGKRACLGRQFAMIEMLTVLSMILQNFHLTPRAGSEPKILECGTLCVDPEFMINFTDIAKFESQQEFLKKEMLFTRSEIAEHCTVDDCWVIFDGVVLDITEYLHREGKKAHPGGIEVILAMAGGDITSEFDFISHTDYARRMLPQFRVGRLVESESILKPEDSSKHVRASKI